MTQAYPLVLIAGVLAGLLWVAYAGSAEPSRAGHPGPGAAKLDACVASLAGALLLARAGFVALHWGTFRMQPATALAFWQGGLAGWGAGLGAVLGLWVFSRATARSFWSLADAVAVPATLVIFSSWLGCLVDGCAYGRSAAGGLLAPPSPDLLGYRQPRVPTQSMGAIAAAASLLVLVPWQRSDPPSGTTGLLALGLLSLSSVAVSQWRADPVALIGGLRSDIVGCAVLAAMAAALWVLRMTTSRGERHERASAGPGPDEHPAG